MPIEEREKICRLFKILGDKNRLQVVLALQNGSKCVHELTEILGVSQSLVSHQLRVLRDADIVRTCRRRNEILYSLADNHIVEILEIAQEHTLEERR